METVTVTSESPLKLTCAQFEQNNWAIWGTYHTGKSQLSHLSYENSTYPMETHDDKLTNAPTAVPHCPMVKQQLKLNFRLETSGSFRNIRSLITQKFGQTKHVSHVLHAGRVIF